MIQSITCKRTAGIALAILIATVSVSDAASPTRPFETVEVRTNSPIHVIQAPNGGSFGDFLGRKAQVVYKCMTFSNTDDRVAKQIVFKFRYYDDLGDFAGDDTFTRSGTFTKGAVNEGVDHRTARLNLENCMPIHYPTRGISLNTFWVQSVLFDDGTSWTAKEYKLPDHLAAWHPGLTSSPSPVQSSSPQPTAAQSQPPKE